MLQKLRINQPLKMSKAYNHQEVFITRISNYTLLVCFMLIVLFNSCCAQEFNLKKINKALEDGYKIIGNRKYDNCVILIGPTGVGKSTILNIIANRKLKVVEGSNDYIFESVENQNSAKINNGYTSETSIPNVHYDSKNNIAFWDFPGYLDSRGQIKEITNGLFMSKALKTCTQIKLHLVLSADNISPDCTRGIIMQQFFEHLIYMFKQKNITDSLTLSVTKVNQRFKGKVSQNLCQFTNEMRKNGTSQSTSLGLKALHQFACQFDKKKRLVLHLIPNPNQQQPKPDEIFEALKMSNYLQQADINIPISEKAKSFIYTFILPQTTQNIKIIHQKILDELSQIKKKELPVKLTFVKQLLQILDNVKLSKQANNQQKIDKYEEIIEQLDKSMNKNYKSTIQNQLQMFYFAKVLNLKSEYQLNNQIDLWLSTLNNQMLDMLAGYTDQIYDKRNQLITKFFSILTQIIDSKANIDFFKEALQHFEKLDSQLKDAIYFFLSKKGTIEYINKITANDSCFNELIKIEELLVQIKKKIPKKQQFNTKNIPQERFVTKNNIFYTKLLEKSVSVANKDIQRRLQSFMSSLKTDFQKIQSIKQACHSISTLMDASFYKLIVIEQNPRKQYLKLDNDYHWLNYVLPQEKQISAYSNPYLRDQLSSKHKILSQQIENMSKSKANHKNVDAIKCIDNFCSMNTKNLSAFLVAVLCLMILLI